jgi:hypothetical protein
MDSANNKTSFLVASQLPEFVRRDHPLFVEFMENYYKFLEQDGQLLYTTKNFDDFYDIDVINADVREDELEGHTDSANSYHILQQKFYDNFIKYIPSTSLADLDLILKHSKDFYRSTGSEKSVRFIARILFNKNADIYYPQTNILKASDGKWFIEKSLNVRDITVDGVANTDAFSRFVNTTIRGNTSNSTAKVEAVNPYFDAGVLVTELKVSGVEQDFTNGEKLFCTIEDEGEFKELAANLYSGIIVKTTVTSPGSGYVQGASVPVEAANGQGAQIIISKVAKAKLEGTIKGVTVVLPGAGYQTNTALLFTGGGGSGAAANVNIVDVSETYHPSSYSIVANTIEIVANNIIANTLDNNEGFAYSNLATVSITTANLDLSTGPGATVNIATLSFAQQNSNVYFETGDVLFVRGPNTYHTIIESNRYYWELNVSPGLAGSLANLSFDVHKKPNVNTVLSSAFNYWTYGNCGPIVATAIINPGSGYVELPSVSVVSNTQIRSLGILGRLEIYGGGTGYANGDVIQFINKPGSYGIGANAQVSLVDTNGTIQQVSWFAIPGHLPGGSGYTQELLPDVSIISANGTNANVKVVAIIGDGAQLESKSDVIGSIQELRIVSGGFGYETPPTLNLSSQGDGTAQAYANIVTGIYTYQGRYLNQDGQLSSYVFLEDRDYYQKYSYVVKIDESLNKYRQALKDLIHPAGLKLFGEYLYEDNNSTLMNTVNVINTSIQTGVNTNSLIVSFDATKPQIDNTGNTWYNDANTQQYANILNAYFTGGGFQFDNGNDKVVMPHASSLNVSNALTVISWFYQDKANSQYKTIVSKSNSGKTRGFEFFSQNNHLEVIVWPITTNNILSYSNTVNANTWHCAAFTYDGSHVRGYLNGAFVDITPGISNSATDTANSLYIGSRSDSANTMNGRIAIVQVYNRALTNNEITRSFNRYRGRFGI